MDYEETYRIDPIEPAPLCPDCEDRCVLIDQINTEDTVTDVFSCDEHNNLRIEITYTVIVDGDDVYFNRITPR